MRTFAERLRSWQTYPICSPQNVFKAWYALFFGSQVCLLPFLVLHFKRSGLSPQDIGILLALQPWISAPAGFIWSWLADRTRLHKFLLLANLPTAIFLRGALMLTSCKTCFVMLVVASEVTNAPVTALTDVAAVSSLDQDADYGKLRLWGGVGWGVCSIFAGMIIERWGLKASLVPYFILAAPCVLLTAAMNTWEPKSAEAKQKGVTHVSPVDDYNKNLELSQRPPNPARRDNLDQGECAHPEYPDLEAVSSSQPHNREALSSLQLHHRKQPGTSPKVKQRATSSHLLAHENPCSTPSTQHGAQSQLDTLKTVNYPAGRDRDNAYTAGRERDNTYPAGRQHGTHAQTNGHENPCSGDQSGGYLGSVEGEKEGGIKLSPTNDDHAAQTGVLGVLRLLRDPHVLCFLFLGYLLGVGLGMIGNFFFLLLEELNGSKVLMGITLTVTCISEIPIFHMQSVLLQYISVRAMLHIVALAYAVRLLCYAMLPWWGTPWAVLPVELLHGVTFACAWGLGTIQARRLAHPGLEATMQGLYQGVFFGMGAGSGAMIAGVLSSKYGYQVMYFWAAAIILAGYVVYALVEQLVLRCIDSQSNSRHQYTPVATTESMSV